MPSSLMTPAGVELFLGTIVMLSWSRCARARASKIPPCVPSCPILAMYFSQSAPSGLPLASQRLSKVARCLRR